MSFSNKQSNNKLDTLAFCTEHSQTQSLKKGTTKSPVHLARSIQRRKGLNLKEQHKPTTESHETMKQLPALSLASYEKTQSYLYQLFETLEEEALQETQELPTADFFRLKQVLQDRVQQLYQYVDTQETFQSKEKMYFRLFGENTKTLFSLYHQAQKQKQPEVKELFPDRPHAIFEFDQLYCTPLSAQRRSKRILEDLDPEHGKILFLGDDDLGSLTLAPHVSSQQVHMLDLDERLLEYIHQKNPEIHCHKVNLDVGVPKDWYESFDAVVLDPPWEDYLALSFFKKALFCLKQAPHARIYLSFSPIYLEHQKQAMRKFFQNIAKHGLTFEQIYPNFSLYSLQDDNYPEYKQKREEYIPKTDSPFMQHLLEIPYACSNFYVIRRLSNYKVNPIKKSLFRLWNGA